MSRLLFMVIIAGTALAASTEPRSVSGKASTRSEPFLFAGFAHKRLTRSHTGREPVVFRVEADFAGTGQWAEVIKFTVPPGQTLEHHFPDAFGAYWLRLITEKDTTATAKLICQ